ncbi:MAG: EamA family transporter [Cyanobacteria bacterium P01_A01_bin.135]
MDILALRGELAALGSAAIWAVTSAVYARVGQRVAPLTLNLLKGLAAIGFTLLTLALRSQAFPAVDSTALWLLLLSGALGIGLGDTAFFASLNCLGARRGLLLEALAPPLAALIAWMALGERLPTVAWLGIGLTVGGVAWVIVERSPKSGDAPPQLRQGIVFGSVAALAQAAGAVLSRAALADTAMPPLWSSLIRLGAGCTVLLLWQGLSPAKRPRVRAANLLRLLALIAATAFASTFLAIWLQQTALKYTETGIAQAIGATSPMFIIPIALGLGERVSSRGILGAAIALVGVWLLFVV